MKKRLLETTGRKSFSVVLMQCLLVMFCLQATAWTANAASADVTVSGTITDQTDGSPLPGVNVLVKGTSTGTVSDLDGNYSINVDEAGTLVFSFIGYVTTEVQVAGRSTIDVSLDLDVQSLEEVVVVGYGTQERAKVTGAIATVESEKITQVPVLSADQALQGRVPGVTVTSAGAPGTSPRVQIRGLGTTGDNAPLVVVDGVIVGGLADINPNDIESINVLKDASTTSIFGALGANGVIMVTTKRGVAGKTRVEFDAYSGIQKVTNRYDLMNKEEYLQYMDMWGAGSGRVDDPQYADLINHDTDWQDEIYQTGTMQSYNLAISGGSESADFRIGAGYIDQEGVLLNTGSDRFNFRANSNYRLGKFKFGESLQVAFTETLPENNDGGRSALEHAIKMPPYFDVYNENNLGGYQGTDSPLDGQDAANPVRVLNNPERNQKRTNIVGNFYGEVELIEGLTLKGQVGLDYFSFINAYHTPSYFTGSNAQAFAINERYSGETSRVMLSGSLNYTKSFGNHTVSALGVAEKIAEKNTRLNTYSTNSITDDIKELSNNDQNISSNTSEYNKYGFLGRLNYDYLGKYLLAGSYRFDGSSRLGPDDKWGAFYSVAGGWVVSEEAFFPDVDAISNLKFRASYGTVGNDRIPNYQYAATIVSGAYNYTFRDQGGGEFLAAGSTAGTVANPELRWEETAMTNFGLDLGLFNDQVTLSAEYYNNVSDGLLVTQSFAPSTVAHSADVSKNAGEVQVDGFEFNLGYNDSEGDFQWSANLNVSTTNNVVNAFGGQERYQANFEGANLQRIKEGESINHFFGYEVDGIFQSADEVTNAPDQSGIGGATMPGDIRYKDLSGPDGTPDGVIDSYDQVVIGNPIPDVNMGLSIDAFYKGFDFNIFINGMYGNEVYNTNVWDLTGVQRLFNASPDALNAWTPTNTDTDVPRLTAEGQNLVPSTRFIEDGSFTRLKNITLGYTLPNTMFNGIFSKARIYVSAQNLITITDYSGLDPEVGYSPLGGNSAQELGVDRGNYPLPKSFIGGIQLHF
ncbi:SusC/RagA family TonB-linked outer membrane protein [Reichenbachiella ulvae]|uniref:TonB-dependent receptor n=1 Tax=Reichenbachiella ulvae TaxID=2980104 RepID=A0ABT3CNT4_9BACT|nr:TonB-dependent receptor [Reichenbachiella ulvae]MCV9385189.1 TonB-dependent receptor [Reichenbachiella ulvae]